MHQNAHGHPTVTSDCQNESKHIRCQGGISSQHYSTNRVHFHGKHDFKHSQTEPSSVIIFAVRSPTESRADVLWTPTNARRMQVEHYIGMVAKLACNITTINHRQSSTMNANLEHIGLNISDNSIVAAWLQLTWVARGQPWSSPVPDHLGVGVEIDADLHRGNDHLGLALSTLEDVEWSWSWWSC